MGNPQVGSKINGVVLSNSNDWGINAIGYTGGIETRSKNITYKIWKRTI